ncbi:hypothetical protein R3P38DRAFT_3175005 [Favolaschia claudopus]|uniref:1,3-beta-glucan synthase component FKS1-like domain-containing protein n=1 Tax=Favolaschia claudopus TaxID=2862362 RepID=A0AAW0DEB9_9AGAR
MSAESSNAPSIGHNASASCTARTLSLWAAFVPSWLGREYPGSFLSSDVVHHPQVRGRLVSVAGVPEACRSDNREAQRDKWTACPHNVSCASTVLTGIAHYTAYNSPAIYAIGGHHVVGVQWSVVAWWRSRSPDHDFRRPRRILLHFHNLGQHLPPHPPPPRYYHRSHILHRHLRSSDNRSNTNLIGMVQFFISVTVTVLFAIVPSGRMFGDRVAGKNRKYLPSQTFIASYPSLPPPASRVSSARSSPIVQASGEEQENAEFLLRAYPDLDCLP